MASSGDRGDAAVPDVHLKMSKKIASLTKVIYLLNTRNDEHQYELQALEESYEAEIQLILRNAHVRINEIRSQLQQSKASGDAEAKAKALVRSLQQKHDEEKQAAVLQLEKLTRQHKEREERITSLARQRVESLKNDVENTRTQFDSRVKSLSQLCKSLEERHEKTVADLRAAHHNELQQVVQTSNEKYSLMLAERLEVEDALKAELEASNQKASQVRSTALESQLKQQATAHDRKMKAALAEQRRVLSQEHEQVIAQMKLELERTQAQQLEQERNAARSAHRVAALEASLQACENALATAEQHRNHDKRAFGIEMQHLLDESNGLKERAAALQSDLAQRDRACADMQQQLEECEGSLRKADNELKRATAEVNQWRREAEEHRRKAADVSAIASDKANVAQQHEQAKNSLQEQLNMSLGQLEDTRAELESTRAERDSLKDELNRAQLKSGQTDAHAANLQEQLAAASRREAELTAELKKTRRDLMDMQAEGARQLEQLRLAHSRQNDAREKEHQRVLEEQIAAAVASAHTDTQSELNKKFQQQQSQLESQLAEQTQLRQAETQALEARAKELEQHVARLQQQIADTAQRMQSSESQLSSALSEAQAQLSAKEQLVQDLRSQLAAEGSAHAVSRSALSAAEAHVLQLEETVQSLRAQQSSDKQQQEREMAAVSDRHAQAIREADRSHRRALEELRLQLQRATAAEVAALRKQGEQTRKEHQAEVEELMQRLEHASNSGSSLEDQLDSLRSDLRRNESAHQEQVASLKEQHAKNIEDAAQQHRAQLERKQQEHAAEMKRLQQTLQTSHDRAIEALGAQHQSALRSANRSAEQAREQLLHQQQNEREASLNAQKELLQQQRLQEVNVLQRSHIEAMQRQEARLSEQQELCRQVEDQLQLVKANLEESQERSHQLEDELQQKHKEMLGNRVELLQRMEQMQDELTTRHKSAMSQLREQHAEAMASKEGEYEQHKATLMNHIGEIERRYESLRQRFQNREPRKEDVDVINSLREKLDGLSKQRKQAMEEAKQMRLELRNREASYNGMFGNRQPLVGSVAPVQSGSGPIGPSAVGAAAASNRKGQPGALPRISNGRQASGLPPLPAGGPGGATGTGGSASSLAGLASATQSMLGGTAAVVQRTGVGRDMRDNSRPEMIYRERTSSADSLSLMSVGDDSGAPGGKGSSRRNSGKRQSKGSNGVSSQQSQQQSHKAAWTEQEPSSPADRRDANGGVQLRRKTHRRTHSGSSSRDRPASAARRLSIDSVT